MARTTTEIRQDIQTAFDTTAGLETLSSPSRVSVFGLLADAYTRVAQTLEMLFDRHTADVDAKLARAQPGTAKWYADRLREFRQGDVVEVGEDGIRYPADASGEHLITQVAAKENLDTAQLFIKLATDDVAAPGGLRALTEAELTQVRGYLARIKFPGQRLVVVSREADRLQLAAEVYYEPLLDQQQVADAVVGAVRGYLRRLEFDGVFYNTRLEDAIQAVPGVKDVRLLQVAVRVGQAVPVVVARAYETQAGYIVEDELEGATLNNTLILIPDDGSSL